MSNNVDLQEIADTLGFDLGDVEMLLNMFIEASNDSLDELKIAISDNNYDAIAASAHAIKGSAANLMINNVVDVAQIIETSGNENTDINYIDKYEELKLLVNSLI